MGPLVRTIQSWLDVLGNLGASLVLVLVLADLMFPGSTGIVENIAELLDRMPAGGQASLGAIFIFLLVHQRWRLTRSPPRDRDSETPRG